jgi:hypothetical protein
MALIADFIMNKIQRGQMLEDEQRRQAQYQGLLERYQMPGEGPVGPQGQQPGYEGFNLSPAFFAEAAGIPGYEALAQGAQGQAGAMQRQQQAQQYGETAPITPFQQAQLEQRQAQLAQQQGQFQQGMDFDRTKHADQLWQWAQELEMAGQPAQRTAPFYNMNGPQQMDVLNRVSNFDQQVATLRDVSSYLNDSNWQQRLAEPGTRSAISAAFQGDFINYARQKFEAGAMQEADLEFFNDLGAGEIDVTQLTSSQRNKVAYWADRAAEDRRNYYQNAFGAAPPPLASQSTIARSLSRGAPGPNIQPIPLAGQGTTPGSSNRQRIYGTR